MGLCRGYNSLSSLALLALLVMKGALVYTEVSVYGWLDEVAPSVGKVFFAFVNDAGYFRL